MSLSQRISFTDKTIDTNQALSALEKPKTKEERQEQVFGHLDNVEGVQVASIGKNFLSENYSFDNENIIKLLKYLGVEKLGYTVDSSSYSIVLIIRSKYLEYTEGSFIDFINYLKNASIENNWNDILEICNNILNKEDANENQINEILKDLQSNY